VALFVALQAALAVVVERWTPELWHPEYGGKLGLLRRRLAETKRRPLVLFMGSSRTLSGVNPAELPHCPCAGGADPLVFNFAHVGAGPLRQLLLLRRLLGQGIRPRHVFLEVMPALLAEDNELAHVLQARLTGWQDLPALRHSWHGWGQRRQWFEDNLVPCLAHRAGLLARVAPWVLPLDRRCYFAPWSFSAGGYLPYLGGAATVSRAEYEKGLRYAHAEYSALLQNFRISPGANRALRKFLDLCRRQGIGVTLVLLPEGSDYRAWYAPHAESCLRNYLDGLCQDSGVRLVDARSWVADMDFADGHHLLRGGTSTFTRRFGRDVYRLVLAGRFTGTARVGP